MKILEYRENSTECLRLFQKLLDFKTEVCLWQPMQEKKVQDFFELTTISKEPLALNFIITRDKKIQFNESRIFCYCESEAFIYSSNVIAIGKSRISIEMPFFLMMLDEYEQKLMSNNNWDALITIVKGIKLPEAKDYMKTKTFLSEEEKFQLIREAPRGMAKEQKPVWVSLDSSENFIEMKLYDLSKGGMALVTEDDTRKFDKDTQILIHQIGEDKFSEPMVGIIRSVGHPPGAADKFKLGIQFLDK